MMRTLHVTPRLVARFMTGIVTLLVTANLIAIYLRHVLGFNFQSIHLFYFNKEGNVPTLYSSISLLATAILLWYISKLSSEHTSRQHLGWKMLAFFFAFLAADEFVGLHENLSAIGKQLLNGTEADGYLHFSWIVPYCTLVLVVMAPLARFFLRLPGKMKRWFLLSAAIFLAGAVGFEMISGRYVYAEGESAKESLAYALMVTAEELLEMAGVIVFVYALCSYYVAHLAATAAVTVSLEPDRVKVMADSKPISTLVEPEA